MLPDILRVSSEDGIVTKGGSRLRMIGVVDVIAWGAVPLPQHPNCLSMYHGICQLEH